MGSSVGLRTRWAAIGAACAVTLGGGTFGVVRAVQTSGERATYVPITPARVLDTRADVGAPDILDATPVLLTVTGTVPTTEGTKTVVPVGASGVVVNITAVNPSVNGFVSLRPGDASGEPQVSTLNVTAGGTFPNGATLTLPASGGAAGQVQIWFEGDGTGGRTDMLIDVVGYYTDHNHDDRYYTKTEVDSALTARANNADVYTRFQVDSLVASTADALATNSQRKIDTSSLLAPSTRGGPYLFAPGLIVYKTSIAIGPEGNPIIAFQSGTPGVLVTTSLKVYACSDATCSGGTTSTLISGIQAGQSPSIAVLPNGNPVISYYDGFNNDLGIVLCSNPTCSSITTKSLDTTGSVGKHSSLTLDWYGNPLITYYDETNGNLKIASCGDTACTQVSTRTIDSSPANVGLDTSIVIGIGPPIIAYHDSTNNALKVIACGNATCSTSNSPVTIASGGSGVGRYPSVNIGIDGLPIMSFQNGSGGLSVAHCTALNCSSSSVVSVDSTTGSGQYTSLGIGLNGSPLISYYDPTVGFLGGAKLAVCLTQNCSSSSTWAIDSPQTRGTSMDMVIGPSGVPIMAYYDSTNYWGKVASAWWLAGGR